MVLCQQGAGGFRRPSSGGIGDLPKTSSIPASRSPSRSAREASFSSNPDGDMSIRRQSLASAILDLLSRSLYSPIPAFFEVSLHSTRRSRLRPLSYTLATMSSSSWTPLLLSSSHHFPSSFTG